jgi:hypothetical protein
MIIVLTGAFIGLINSTGIWGDGQVQPIEANYDLSGFESIQQNTVWDQFTVYVTFLQTMWNIATSALQMLIFAYPLLIGLGCPPALAVIFQGGIWVVTLFWVIDILRR